MTGLHISVKSRKPIIILPMSNFRTFIDEHSVQVPLIQRDYVQGRDINAEKRDKFLLVMLDALKDGGNLSLDFIYGTSSTDGKFLPLDGQQRLTTLCLLCLLLSKRSGIIPKERTLSSMRSFSYLTRLSSSKFCEKLFCEETRFPEGKISDFIKGRNWYSEDWDNDPTIRAMLEMMDAINVFFSREEYRDYLETIAQNLYGEGKACIEFEELDMGKYGLSDSLYIKMNARGKQLTEFENWKASFIKFLSDEHEGRKFEAAQEGRTAFLSLREYFEYSIEHEWADMLWGFAYSSWAEAPQEYKYPVIDDGFMRLFQYICSMLFFTQNDKVPQNGMHRDIVASDFDPKSERQQRVLFKNPDNISFLFQSLDFFSSIDEATFFDELLMNEGSQGDKVRLFGSDRVNLFRECINGDEFVIQHQLLLWCILKYCIQHKINTPTNHLKDFVRIARNLLESISQRLVNGMAIRSSIRVADFKSHDAAINAIIENEDTIAGLIGLGDRLKGLSLGKLTKEREKLILMQTLNESDKKAIYSLENQPYLHGDLSMLRSEYLLHPRDLSIVLSKFMSLPDLQKIQLLISFGFEGETIGSCGYGKNRFFGKDNKWDFVLTSTQKTSASAVNKMVGAFMDNADSMHEYLRTVKAEVAGGKHDFRYYALTYDSFMNATLGEAQYYFSTNGDLDDLNIIAFCNFKPQPLRSYHCEPFGYTIREQFKSNPQIYNDLGCCSINNDRAWLLIKSMDIHIRARKEGWEIRIGGNGTSLPADLSPSGFRIRDSIVLVSQNSDLIETGVKVVEWICATQHHPPQDH